MLCASANCVCIDLLSTVYVERCKQATQEGAAGMPPRRSLEKSKRPKLAFEITKYLQAKLNVCKRVLSFEQNFHLGLDCPLFLLAFEGVKYFGPAFDADLDQESCEASIRAESYL
jgi:hypothetical protein